jgi:hypothetical protein
MKNKTLITLALLGIFLLVACGAKTATQPATEAAAPTAATPTPDPCSKENLPDEVMKVSDLMREFDDYSMLASRTPQDKLVQVIPPMQEVRRRAQSQEVPECLANLKVLQINHMDIVIDTLIVLWSNPQLNQDALNTINNGITQARDLHMKYDMEIARLLGLTLVPPPTFAPGTPGAGGAPMTPPAELYVINLGPAGVTLYATPDLNAGGVATLKAGLTTVAFGKTADGLWIQVEVPGQAGQKAWASASTVQVSGQLPVVTP